MIESDNFRPGDEERSEGLNYYNPASNENALKLRLETEDTIEKIEMYLSGQEYIYKGDELVKVAGSIPKANKEGVRSIMSIIIAYANKSGVQGNTLRPEVNRMMADFHRYIGRLLSVKAADWNIIRDDRRDIVNFIEPFIFLFITRTVENKERESYGMTIRESGRQVFEKSKGFFKS